MADEVVGLDLEVRLQGAETVGELKNILKDARNAAVKFGEGTPEFEKFTKVAAKAKDEIGDLNERISALDPGEKAKAFQSLGNTIVGGFQAAAGTLAVFTGDNEQLNNILMRSMAIVQAMQGIQAIADAKKQLGIVKSILGIKAETAATEGLDKANKSGIVSAKGLRIALISTGVGALVVAVGLLIANFDKVKKAVTDLFPVLNNLGAITEKVEGFLNGMWEGFKKTFSNIGEALSLALSGDIKGAFAKITDFQSVVKAGTQGYHNKMQEIAKEAADKQLQITIDENKRKLAIMEAGQKDVYAFKRKILKDELSLMKQGTDEEIAAYKDKQNEIAVLDAQREKELADKNNAANEKKKAADKKAKEEADKLAAEKKKAEEEAEAERKKIRDQFAEEQLQYNLSEQERELLEAQRKKEAFLLAGVEKLQAEEFYNQQVFDIKNKYNQLELDAQAETDKKSQDALDKSNADKLAKEKALQEAKLSIAQTGANGIISIGQLMTSNAKKQEVYNKIAAGIQIGIDTSRGIMAAVASAKGATGFDYIAQVAAGIGVVLANAVKAKQLLSKVGGSTPDVGLGQIPAASQGASQSAPFQPTSQKTLLADAEKRREGQKPDSPIIKAYVVETELTENQKNVATMKDRSVR